MSQRRSVKTLATTVAALPDVVPATLEPPPDADEVLLNRELAKNAAASASPPGAEMQHLLTKAPDDLSFRDLEQIARVDLERMQSRWAEVKAAARDELASGWRAGQAVEDSDRSAWERASFLAVRQALRDTWPPRSAGEALLLDEMAQYEMLRLRWLRILTQHTVTVHTLHRHTAKKDEGDATPSLTQAAATREAVLMLDRLQRLMQRTLRMLLTLRRGHHGAIIVRQAGQINVTAGPQMNVHTGAAEQEQTTLEVLDA